MDRAALIAAMRASPLEVREVVVAGWGTLHVRELTTEAVDRLNRAKDAAKESGAVNALALSAASTICDADGNLLFNVADTDDIALLAGQGFGKLSRVLAAANALAAAEDSGAKQPGPASRVPA